MSRTTAAITAGINAVGTVSQIATEQLVVKPFHALEYLLRNYFLAIFSAAALALVLRIFFFEAYRIPTDFMAPLLLPGDHIFVNKAAYSGITSKAPPSRGDVVIINFPSDARKDYIKRVIAVGGDTVEIRDGIIHLNKGPIGTENKDKTVTENIDGRSWLARWGESTRESRTMMHVTVPDGQVFVLGDNRSKGQDSRNWGFLPVDFLKGRAALIWLSISPDKEGGFFGIRWPRVFTKIE
jgi:signal peptidase I